MAKPWFWSSNKPKQLESAELSIIKNVTITDTVIGSGSYGTVYGAEYNGKPCVAKVIHSFLTKAYKDGPTPTELCRKEINTLSALRHPSIVQFLGVYFEDKSDVPILVMEKMWTNLSTLLKEKPHQLPLLIKTHILYDVACGLQYLHGHEKPVVHRDLNANNILLTKHLVAKIADLGQARVLDTIGGQTLTRIPGNVAHMALEACEKKPTYNSKLDIFSFGCTVIHAVTEQFPEPTEEFVETQNKYFKKESEVDRRRKFIDLMAESSTSLQEIALACLQEESSKRLNALDVCSKLKRHLEELEVESPILATHYKEGKLYLMRLVQSQEDELESTKTLAKKHCEEKEHFKKKMSSLQKELARQNEAIKQITARYDTQVDRNETLENTIKEITNTSDVYKQKNSMLISEKEDLTAKHDDLNLRYNDLQGTCKRQQQEISCLQSEKNTDSNLRQQLLEIQHVNKNVQHQLSDLKKQYTTQEQQLEEKSSTLESSLNEQQELKEKLKLQEQRVTELSKLLERKETLLSRLTKECKSKDESLKRKESEHADDISNIRNQHSREVQSLVENDKLQKSEIIAYEQVKKQMENEAEYKSNLAKNDETKIKKLQIELECLVKQLKRQNEYHENEKVKHTEMLKKSDLIDIYGQCNFKASWYPYLSLPVKRMRSSVTIVKDKVFVAGGYKQISHQDEGLNSYMNSMEKGDKVFCFRTTKCRYDSIASPVVLGGVASVNGQCVLVSGAEGNTLTGNVYVLCEEESDEQWKKFSEPVPTPRILPCVCCYGERWMIVCGGYACKEGSNLLEAVNVVEILDTTKGKWYTLSKEHCPNAFNILYCGVVDEDVYFIGDNKILTSKSNQLITIALKKSEWSVPLWSEIETQIEGIAGNLHPFSVVDVNGEPVIIASISGSENDMTCVLMKDTTGTWRKMSEAVECQHCSAVVVTPTLELLLFGGSEKMSAEGASDMSQKGTLIPTFSLYDNLPMLEVSKKPTSSENNNTLVPQDNILEDVPVSINQPPAISFTGPIHTKQFDHKGGTFQSPVHKVSIVVPPNAIDDGEKVTVYMGATTSGPFDLPEDCKLRSAVVWLGSGSDVVLKRSIAVVVPHSAVFTSPQHHSMMRFLVCEDCEGPRYKFRYSMNHFDIDTERGWIELSKFVMVAVVAGPDFSLDDEGVHSEEEYGSDDDEFHDTLEDISLSSLKVHRQRSSPKGKTLRMPPVRYLAKLFWPRGQILNSFRVDVYYLQNLPTELYKVNTLYRKAYYEDNGAYPEIVGTEFMVDGDGTELKCVLPCSGSSECDCLSGWSVTRMNDISEVSIGKDTCNYKDDPMKFSFKFDCTQAKANLICCFEFRGADRIMNNAVDQVPDCLQKRYHPPDNAVPFVLQKLIHYEETAVEQQHYTHEMNGHEMNGHEMNGHEMNAQEEEGPVMDSHQIKNLL